MSFTIQNTSTHRVVLRLNSGRLRHLSPGAEASGVSEAEVRGNAQIDRLRDRNRISVVSTPQPRSSDMTAREAIAHIRDTPVEALRGFLADDEERVTVLEAWEEKHGET